MTRMQRVSLVLVVASVVPYILLKLLWLGGSQVGMRPGSGVGEMGTPRMIIGNVLTVMLELVAVGLAFALAGNWGRRIPAWLIVGIAGAATGLLAPIIVGLPPGVLIQAVIDGTLSSGEEGNLEGWVFLVTYGAFGVLGISLAALLVLHILDRWRRLLASPPQIPRQWWARLAAVAVLPFGLSMCYWGVAGPGAYGPAGMDAIAQRSVLVATGLLTLMGPTIPLVAQRWPLPPIAAWALTWTGCATAALQGPAQLILAREGRPATLVAVLGLVAAPAAVVYGFTVLYQRISASAQECSSSPPAAPAVGSL